MYITLNCISTKKKSTVRFVAFYISKVFYTYDSFIINKQNNCNINMYKCRICTNKSIYIYSYYRYRMIESKQNVYFTNELCLRKHFLKQ